MSVEGPPVFGLLWNLWMVGPLAILVLVVIVSWLLKPANASLTLQETPLIYKGTALLGGAWLLVSLVITVWGRLRPFGKVLLVDVGLAAIVGFSWTSALVSFWARPRSTTPAEPATFEWVRSARQSVEAKTTSGPAAGAHFMFAGKDWGNAKRGVGKDQPIPGKVYRGGHGLWYAKLD
ncbi:MAG TPA: hypothetical protein VHO67_17920 [Polyangia bacterium]|nr:hypothetical protein [Polyangia bacterium]